MDVGRDPREILGASRQFPKELMLGPNVHVNHSLKARSSGLLAMGSFSSRQFLPPRVWEADESQATVHTLSSVCTSRDGVRKEDRKRLIELVSHFS